MQVETMENKISYHYSPALSQCCAWREHPLTEHVAVVQIRQLFCYSLEIST